MLDENEVPSGRGKLKRSVEALQHLKRLNQIILSCLNYVLVVDNC